MKVRLCPSLLLTNERSESSYGVPVLVLRDGTTDPRAYGPADLLEFANALQPAAMWGRRFGRLKVRKADREFCARFLKSWADGPQL